MELDCSIKSGCEADFFQPLLAHLALKKAGLVSRPYVPKWEEAPLYKLAKFAKVLKEAGFEKEAARLALELFCLKDFPSLWCPEKGFLKKKIQDELFSLESIFFEKEEASRLSPCFEGGGSLDVRLLKVDQIKAAITFSGKETGLGAILAGPVHILAFGPQTESMVFGIEGKGDRGWVQMFADPEKWLSMEANVNLKKIDLKFHFVGLDVKEKSFMAFYLQAENCRVGSKNLFPNSLERYKGNVSSISFNHHLYLEPSFPSNIQIIPLSGKGHYWESTFLALFELSPFVSQISFSLFLKEE